MNNHPALLTALLLGGLTFSTSALAQDAAPLIDADAVAVAAAPPAETAAASTDGAPAPADDTDTDEVATEAVPAWVGRVLVSAEPQPGPDGQPASDRTLRLVQRSTTGKVVAGKIALSLLAGTIGGSTFNKNQLQGTRIDTVPNPAFDDLKEQMRARMTTYFAAHPGAIPEQEARVQATVGQFSLVYKELGNAQTEYELQQYVHVGFAYRRKLLRLSGGEGAHCSPSEPVSAPLEAWQADDYAMARQVAQQYTEACAAKFAAALPTLFPDRAPVAASPEAAAAVADQEV